MWFIKYITKINFNKSMMHKKTEIRRAVNVVSAGGAVIL